MRGATVWLTAALAAVLLLAAVVVYAQVATSRVATISGREVGEVLVDGQVVFRLRSAAEGFSAAERAAQVADRLTAALVAGVRPAEVHVTTLGGAAVVMARDLTIITADRREAEANGISPQALANAWAGNLRVALGGERLLPAQVAGSREAVDWTGQANKVVPILSVGTPGVSIGAARVSGPERQVSETKAVAQLEAEFRRVARIRVLIPVSDLDITRPQRVQGVSVNALIDMRVVGF